MLLASLLVLAAVTGREAAAWYLPGSAPRSYAPLDPVDVTVNALTPSINPQNQIKSLVSYDFYDDRLHFCKPPGGPQRHSENLGEALFGDRILTSPLEVRMLQNTTCQTLCTSAIPPGDAKFINDRIRESYTVNWAVDGLPVAHMMVEEKTQDIFYSVGFALGSTDGPLEQPVLYNHFTLYLEYHERSPQDLRVVGALIWLKSIDHSRSGGSCSPASTYPLVLSESARTSVAYTYDVIWRPSDVPWALRWDAYLRVFDPRIHWMSLANSALVVGFLCAVACLLLLRAANRDITRYNAVLFDDEGLAEDWGWKLIHGEVFRAPRRPLLLSVLVGSGAHLLAMSSVTLVFALLGFLSPSNRGSLGTALLVTYVLFGSVSGWVSMRTYMSMDGEKWKQCMFLSATLLPTTVFAAMHLLNFFLVGSGASGAVPFGTMAALVALWFLVSTPLCIIGAILALRRGAANHPTKVHPIPRQIPPRPWYMGLIPSTLMCGILPFGAIAIEGYYLSTSVWGGRIYYAFGFLSLTLAIAFLASATVAVLNCYFTLCREEWRWQWRAFLTGGGSAFWLVAFGLLYSARLALEGFVNKVLFTGYLLLAALLWFIVTGSIGWLACYATVRTLYSRVLRID